MAFKTISSPVTDITGSLLISMPINGSAFFSALAVRSFIFYDSGGNIVTPTAANIDVRCITDLEDLTQYKQLPFYTTNMALGNYQLVNGGSISHLTDPNSGITTISTPIELVEIRLTGVTGAAKVKIKLALQKARV